RYDFPQLVQASPELRAFMQVNKFGDESIDFANPAAVKTLNRALLKQFYGMAHWDIPEGYLCPPIPGRADYLHNLADLLASGNNEVVPRGAAVSVLDVGVGANCIYPIIGHQEYGWRFVGSDVDPVALRSAQQIVAANPALTGAIECRLQTSKTAIFDGIIRPGEVFDLVMCNPPFHASAAEAAAASQRKASNLGTQRNARPVLNFGGQNAELWCPGGEVAFVRRMVQESMERPQSCHWFTALVSKKESLIGVKRALHNAQPTEVRILPMAQGQKKSRLVAWTFLTPEQRQAWQVARWSKR
ncbi:MAG: rRNA methyltransferase, partial [Hymenobacter sp.]|nr:rRNA methyltransferase [Hymenobacter sp.]